MRRIILYLTAVLIGAAAAVVTAHADNVTVTEGVGKTIGFDSIGGVNYQRMKLIHGADDTNSGDISTSNPFPIQMRTSGGTETGTAGNPIQCSLANTGSNATPVVISGTVQPGNTANTTAWMVKEEKSSSFLSIDLDETEEAVKASAGFVTGYFVRNRSAGELFVKLYNDTVGNVEVGTTTPKLVFPIPAGQGANNQVPMVEFDQAITAACTTGVAHDNTGAPGANECVVDIYYK